MTIIVKGWAEARNPTEAIERMNEAAVLIANIHRINQDFIESFSVSKANNQEAHL